MTPLKFCGFWQPGVQAGTDSRLYRSQPAVAQDLPKVKKCFHLKNLNVPLSFRTSVYFFDTFSVCTEITLSKKHRNVSRCNVIRSGAFFLIHTYCSAGWPVIPGLRPVPEMSSPADLIKAAMLQPCQFPVILLHRPLKKLPIFAKNP